MKLFYRFPSPARPLVLSILVLILLGDTAKAASCFSEAFTNTNTNLNGYNGWAWSVVSGTSSAGSQITINNNQVRIIGDSSTIVRESGHFVSCGDPNGVLWVKIKIQKGTVSNAVTPLNFWNIWLDDSAGVNFARWYGTGWTARGRLGQSTDVTVAQILTGGLDELGVKLDFAANTTQFFFNNVSVGSISHGSAAANTLNRIRFEKWGGSTPNSSDTIYFDDITTELTGSFTYSTQYEMNASPTTTANVTDTSSTDWNLSGILNNVNMPGSGGFSGGLLNYVTVANTSEYGYYFVDQKSTHTVHSYTIDMGVQVNSGVTPASGANRSMSFSGGPISGAVNGGRNRGFRLNTSSVQLINGVAPVGTGNVDLASGTVRLRLTYNGGNNNYSCYNLDTGQTLISPQVAGLTGAAAEISDRGGYAIGSLDTTSNSNFQLDYFRVLLDVPLEDASPINTILVGGCGTTLDNPSTKTSDAVSGQTALPNSFDYKLSNIGVTTLNYTVVEATSSGATNDYSWLSVAPSSGSITAGSNATITATITNTTGLAPGVYTGYLRINGCSGQYELRRIDLTILDCSNPVTPYIITHPQSQSACSGAAVAFSVSAYGTGLTYQWRKNGANIANGPTGSGSTYSGATSATLTITGTAGADAGNYDVVVDRLCSPPAPVTSNTAVLGVNNPLSIACYPLPQKNYLFWTNPCGNFTGTMIRYRTDMYPTSPTDGTLVVDKSGTAGQSDYFMHTGLINGTTYYYAAFAHDAVPNYSLAVTASGTPVAPPAGSGPGVPNIPYPSNKLFQIIGSISPTDLPGFHATAVMHNGYMVIQHVLDSAGGNAFYDISNPFQPVLVNTSSNSQMMEGHAIGFSNSYPGMYACTMSNVGIEFWDWTNVMNPVLLSTLTLPGISGAEYDTTVWWLFWQAPYVYVGGTTIGLFVVDATDPSSPVLVKQMSNSQTGGFRVGSVFAVGNLLVINSNDANGAATFDISNPTNPILLASNMSTMPYSGMVNGDKLLLAATGGIYDFGLVVFDISNPAQINFVNKYNFADRGGYLTVQDGYAHVGASSIGYDKIDIRNPAIYVLTGTGDFVEPDVDLDFPSVMGNLTICSDDEGFGTRIMPHQASPDTTPPAVNMINPKPGATSQALTSRVGLTFTDRIDLRSVNTSTFIVRPLGGSALLGKYSEQTSIVNFCPSSPLQPNTTYEVIVPAGGIKDYVGNPTASTYSSQFSTGSTVVNYSCQIAQNPPAPINQSVIFDIQSCDDPGPFTYSWNFGDGSPATPFSSTSSTPHTYTAPGHYLVFVTVKKGAQQTPSNTIQTIYNPLTPVSPTHSVTIALDASRQRIWNVNADANTVTCCDAVGLTKLFEVPVGTHPRNLAVAPDGNIWVTNEDSTTISVISGNNGAPIATVPMPYASQPYGIAFSPTGNAAYVTLMATGQLVKLDPTTHNVLATLPVGPTPKGIAITYDGARIFVTRFISPLDHGEVVEVSGSTFTVTRTFQLALNPGPDGESASRGVPNYVFAPTIAPDGLIAWVPSKKDNTGRGQFMDGLNLTFETTVRTIVSKLDLTSNTENMAARHDLDNRSLASAVAFTNIGDYAMVATLGSNTVNILDAYTSLTVSDLLNVGLAPDGLVVSTDGQRLFVHNFMSRDIAVYDVSQLAKTNVFPLLARINTVQTELLPVQILQGKQIFYNAADTRMDRDKYISCAVCHFDGDSDGRVWDFTDRGEGLRNTISLNGHAGMRQGPVHWSANFDEIQDFEGDIRNAFQGKGFMSDPDFHANSRSQSLGTPKAGVSAELDALAAYVASLKRVPASPYRNPDGSMTADAIAGQKLFHSVVTGCSNCHRGPQITDSELHGNPFVLHDVGTITPASGRRLDGPLTGLDTPTLKGVWETPPYLHDGSAATLMDVITIKNPNDQHGNTSQLTAAEIQQLVAYLQQIDNVARCDFTTDGDVDQSDFGFLQNCFSDAGPGPGCDWADLNGDGLISGLDYNLFKNCVTGADIPADLNCAE